MVVVYVGNIDWIVYDVFIVNVVFEINYGRYIYRVTIFRLVYYCNCMVAILGNEWFSRVHSRTCRSRGRIAIFITGTLFETVFIAMIPYALFTAGTEAIILIQIATTRCLASLYACGLAGPRTASDIALVCARIAV